MGRGNGHQGVQNARFFKGLTILHVACLQIICYIRHITTVGMGRLLHGQIEGAPNPRGYEMATLFPSTSRSRVMDIEFLKTMVPLLLTGLTTLGGAVAWLINRMDRKAREERKAEKEEREKLEKLFSSQIEDLQNEIHSQNQQINRLRYELTVYVRHVGILEGLLKAHGIDPPTIILEPVGK